MEIRQPLRLIPRWTRLAVDRLAGADYIADRSKRVFECASTNWQVVVGGSPIRGRNGESPWPRVIYAGEKSDIPIVPKKLPNKRVHAARRR